MKQSQVAHHQNQPHSLLNCHEIVSENKVRVYYLDFNQIQKVSVCSDDETTAGIILQAVKKLNKNKKLHLSEEASQYELFAARKDGRMDDGLPALDHNQYIQKTQLKRFYLSPLYKIDSPTTSGESKDSLHSIKSELNMNNISHHEVFDLQPKKRGFSFCGIFCYQK